jgi:hypothetical protein
MFIELFSDDFSVVRTGVHLFQHLVVQHVVMAM